MRTRPIARKWLLLALAVVTTVPPAIVVAYALAFPSRPERRLPIDVQLTMRHKTVHTEGGASAAIVPELTIRNMSGQTLRNVTIAINDAFYYYHVGEVAAGGSVTVATNQFVTKQGAFAFPARQHTIEEVIVFAQMPDGVRAVADITYDGGLPYSRGPQ